MTYEDFEVIYGQLTDLAGKFCELNSQMSLYYLQESLEEAELSKEERDVLVDKLAELRKAGALAEAEEILTNYQGSVLAGALALNLSPADGGETFTVEEPLSEGQKGLAEMLAGCRAEVKVSQPSGKAEIEHLEPGDGVVGDKVKVPWDGIQGYFAIGETGWKKLQEAGYITTYEKFLDSLEVWLKSLSGAMTADEYQVLESLYQSYMYVLRGNWSDEELWRWLGELADSRGLIFTVETE